MIMARNFVNEAKWVKNTYKIYTFKARIDNGEADRLKAVLKGKTFAEWVREKFEAEKIEDE